ncbi:MAG: RNA polymerase sigma factor SigZ [Rectinemataceae bacterium]
MIGSEHVAMLWDRYRERLFGFIRGKVSSPEEAEDILQEVFIKIHTGLCCLQEWPAMEKWIYRVARNLIIDHYRARRGDEELDEDIESHYGSAELDDDPAARIAFSLKETVDELPEPYREALLLTEYEGLTQAEMAERAGISLPAAKSRILRARKELKALLLECCHFELDRLGGIINYEKRCASCDAMRRVSSRP